MKKLSIVIPCFNSAENIPDLRTALYDLQSSLSNYETEFIFVDDGSSDNTYNLLLELQRETYKVKIIKLTGNFGSYNAFLAGLNHGSGDVYAQLHPDLQDPPHHLIEMLPYWEKGIPFVIGLRIDRQDKDTTQFFARMYHRLIKKIALPHIPEGGYDLIIFDKLLRDRVVEMNESNTNLVYLISWLKYPFVTVPLVRVTRLKGKSQWTIHKKWKLLLDSIVSFSYTPVKCITIAAISLLMFSLLLFVVIFFSDDWPKQSKWIVTVLLLFGNAGMISISIIAEYLWRTLEAARKRPPFIVETITTN